MAELTNAEIVKFIKLYEGQENLYNTDLTAYHNRSKQLESCKHIATMMGKGWDVKATKLKIKSIRSSYTRQRNAMIESRLMKGVAEDDIKVKWRWWSLVDPFLRPYCTHRKPLSNSACTSTTGTSEGDSQSGTLSHDQHKAAEAGDVYTDLAELDSEGSEVQEDEFQVVKSEFEGSENIDPPSHLTTTPQHREPETLEDPSQVIKAEQEAEEKVPKEPDTHQEVDHASQSSGQTDKSQVFDSTYVLVPMSMLQKPAETSLPPVNDMFWSTASGLSDAESVKLIQLYKSQENLYNPNLCGYYDFRMKHKSYQYIAKEMGKDWDEKVIKIKIKSIRSSYAREKLQQASEQEKNLPSKSKWKWFSLVDSFLNPFYRPRIKPGCPAEMQNDSRQDHEGAERDNMQHNIQQNDMQDIDSGCASDIAQLLRQTQRNETQNVLPNDDAEYSLPGSPSSSCASMDFCPDSPVSSPSSLHFSGTPDLSLSRKRKGSDSAGAAVVSHSVDLKLTETKAAKTEKTLNEIFCSCLASQLDKMNREDQRTARMQIQEILTAIEEKNSR